MAIEDIRRKKMQEISNRETEQLEAQLREQQKAVSQMQQQISVVESIAKQYMDKNAISRYGAVKMAHPETAVKAIAFIAQAGQLGHLKNKLNDEDFKKILQEVKEGKTKFSFKNLKD